MTILLTLGLLACTPTDPDTEGAAVPDGPGTEAWGDIDVTCDADADCLSAEACIGGICQIEKCAGSLTESSPPIGQGLTFLRDDDIGVAGGGGNGATGWVHGYSAGSGASFDDEWEISNKSIADIAGGDLWGARPGGFVAILENDDALIGARGGNAGGARAELDLDIVPVALAAGDVDGDGLDEAVAVSSDGKIAICSLDTETCESAEIDRSGTVVDVAVGDLDGDGVGEVIALLRGGGDRVLHALSLRDGSTWNQEMESDENPVRIDAADLDGDGLSEVFGLWNDDCWDWCDDAVRVWTSDGAASFTETLNEELDGYEVAIDLAAGDTDRDDMAEVVVLSEGNVALTLSLNNSGRLGQRSSSGLSAGGNHHRIALSDHDGDAPRATLDGGPIAVQGNTVPLMLMLLPPYDSEHSNGVAWAGFGDDNTTNESLTDTVSLGAHVDVGVSGDFWGLFGGEASTKVSWAVDRSWSSSTSTTFGGRYSISADPGLYGERYGGVVLSWGCFDGYTYTIDDPKDRLGGLDGEQLVVTAPTGGGVSLWSTPRYNAMAEAVGGLPIMKTPYDVGRVLSYPSDPEDVNGEPLANTSLVFPDPRSYIASDVGEVGWSDIVGQTESNSSALSQSIGVSAGVVVGGVTVGAGVDYGWGEGYSISVGNSAIFSGGVPPIPDDPATAGDEYVENAYTVTPWVYTQPWSDDDGNEASYYVMTYTVQ